MFTIPHTWLEINKKAFHQNIQNYKQLIGNAMIGVVVKSNAYGHGLYEIASLCQENPNVAWLCTATLSEALFLRAHGITKNIVVMTLIDTDPEQAISQNIDLFVHDAPTIEMLNALAKQQGKRAQIHLKIDTGMSRFGLYHDEALNLICKIISMSNISLRGLCTHFSESNSENQEFTYEQLNRFHILLNSLKKLNIIIPIIHASNSAAATIIPEAHFNLVRIGAAAYGLWPSEFVRTQVQQKYPTFDLQPVMTWKTKIMQIRELAAEQYVGYARSYKTGQPTAMGIMPIGYFDGYDRRLSNKGKVLAFNNLGESFYADVMGIVCMNATMINLATHTDIQPGNEIILLGNYEYVNATYIAHTIGSFNPREVTTRINPAIPRIIV